MATIEARPTDKGKISYRVMIRKKGINIYKTFHKKEDAELYVFYKERLIDNIENFEVPLGQMVTLDQIFELKISSISISNKREINDYENCKKRLKESFSGKVFYKDISLDDWRNAAKSLLATEVYRGAKTENGKRLMSPVTLKKIYYQASSVVSYVKSQGIVIDNHPLTILQTYINPMLKKDEKST